MTLAPAARIDDPVTHDMLVTCGKIDFPLTGPCPHGMVMIEGKIAAHVNCSVYCAGVMNSGAVPHPLHAPPPPLAPAVPKLGPPKKLNPCEEDDDTCEETETFFIQVMGGSTRAIGTPTEISIGQRLDNITFKITDSEGNSAIYDFAGSGDNKSVALLPITADQPIAAGDPAPFTVPKGTSVKDFDGPARMTIDEAIGENNVTFRFGIPTESVWDRFGWNEDWWDDYIHAPAAGIIPSPLGIDDYAVRVEDMELKGENHDPFSPIKSSSPEEAIENLLKNATNLFDTLLANPSIIGTGESKGFMELDDYIPAPVVPPPVVKPVPCLNPIVKGSTTVRIHGMPAARWAPSGDTTTCGTMLGDIVGLGARTVWIGG